MVRNLYICSAGHSGSTLLDLLLGSHSRIESLGEISQLSKCIALNTECSCGKPTLSCSRWQDVIRRFEQDYGIDIRRNPYSLNLGRPRAGVVIDKSHQTLSYLVKRKLLFFFAYLEQRFGIPCPAKIIRGFQQGIDNTHALYEYVREISGADVVVDSSKGYLKAVGVYLRKPDDTRLIVLSRDGRGVFYSNLKRNFPRRSSLNNWRKYYSRALPILERNVLPEHIISVKYEDLAERPEQELRRICHFAGLEFEEGMLHFSSKEHHITAGNNMRFGKSSTISLDTSWQRALAEKDRAYFLRRAAKINEKLGYK